MIEYDNRFGHTGLIYSVAFTHLNALKVGFNKVALRPLRGSPHRILAPTDGACPLRYTASGRPKQLGLRSRPSSSRETQP